MRSILMACVVVAFAVPCVASTLDVLCTTTIVGDLVGRVGAEDVALHVLFPPDTDPHAFEPRPQDLAAMEQADIIFINGAGLEETLEDVLSAVETPIIDLSEAVDLLFATHEDDHAQADPHIWFDPQRVSQWVDAIADALSERAPDSEEAFRTHTATLKGQLEDLDVWILGRVEQLSASQRVLATDHQVLGYFADRYGFEQVGFVSPGLTTLSEPSAREFADLVAEIQELDVPAIFVGMSSNEGLARQVANETAVQLVRLYTGALSDSEGPASTYFDFMQFDVDAIVNALGGSDG